MKLSQNTSHPRMLSGECIRMDRFMLLPRTVPVCFAAVTTLPRGVAKHCSAQHTPCGPWGPHRSACVLWPLPVPLPAALPKLITGNFRSV